MKKEHDEDIFFNFLIKEKEIACINKSYAQASVKYMGKCYKEQEENSTLLQKSISAIRDFFVRYYLYFISYINKLKIKDLTEEDKKNKIIQHKKFKHGEFKIHFYLIRKFQRRTLVDDSCCVDMPNYEFEVSMRIEYNKLITSPHLKDNFKNESDAINYFNEILNNNKKKNAITIINELSNDMDKAFYDLKKRTEYLESKLIN